MKYLNSESKKILCANADSPFAYFGWPSVARLQDGTLAMATSGFRFQHVCPFGKGVICYSRDEGKTWTLPAVVMDTLLDDRDSGITPFGNGSAIFTSFNNTTAFQRGVNEGRLKSDNPVELAKGKLIQAYLDYADALGTQDKYLGSTYRISRDGGYTFGEIRKMPITAPHGPARLNDGTLLYVGRRYDPNDRFDDAKTPYVECWHSADGETWEKWAAIDSIFDGDDVLYSCEPHAVQLPDGKIVVHIRVQGGKRGVFTVYQSDSVDGGHTFSSPRRLLDWNGGSPAHLLLHSSGRLMSVYGYRNAPFGIRVMLSKDGGDTWEKDWILDDTAENGDLGYPATVELSDGSLLTVFYESVKGTAVIMQKNWKLP